MAVVSRGNRTTEGEPGCGDVGVTAPDSGIQSAGRASQTTIVVMEQLSVLICILPGARPGVRGRGPTRVAPSPASQLAPPARPTACRASMQTSPASTCFPRTADGLPSFAAAPGWPGSLTQAGEGSLSSPNPPRWSKEILAY